MTQAGVYFWCIIPPPPFPRISILNWHPNRDAVDKFVSISRPPIISTSRLWILLRKRWWETDSSHTCTPQEVDYLAFQSGADFNVKITWLLTLTCYFITLSAPYLECLFRFALTWFRSLLIWNLKSLNGNNESCDSLTFPSSQQLNWQSLEKVKINEPYRSRCLTTSS